MKKIVLLFIAWAVLLIPLGLIAKAADQGTGHTVEFRFPDNKVVASYATFDKNESRRSKRFFPRASVVFENVEAGDYFANFQLKSKQWVVPGEPEVEAEHRELNAEVEMKIDQGEWVRLGPNDTVRAYGSHWNLLIRVP